MKFVKGIIASALFLFFAVAIYVVHIKFFRVDVVFYSALVDGVAASLVTLLLVSVMSWFRIFSVFEKTLLFIIWLLTAYAVAISVPTVIDRSLSFYILEKLEQRGGGIELARFEEVFTNEYLYEHRLVDVRLTEQQASGTIVIEGGCVLLTDWGSALAGFSRYFRTNFLPEERLLMDEYSDDLTDPFRHSGGEVPDYSCGK
jgi:hypothetical protein